MAALHNIQEEAGSEPPTKKRHFWKKEMVELHQCLLSIEPSLSKRRHFGVVRCPGIIKSTLLFTLQTTSIFVRLAILCTGRAALKALSE